MKRMKIVGLAGGLVVNHGGEIGGWVKEYDPDAYGGGGELVSTDDPAEAKLFASLREALDFWRQVSTVQPTRWDGEPNRPLTAFHIAIEEAA